jgi:preprotein translocase subunit SecG
MRAAQPARFAIPEAVMSLAIPSSSMSTSGSGRVLARALVIVSVVMLAVMVMGALQSYASNPANSLNEIEAAVSGQPLDSAVSR